MAGNTETGKSKEERKDKGIAIHNGKLIAQMLNAFIRGREPGSGRERAAALVEGLWKLATGAENESTRLAAIREIFDRVDGRAVERREVRSLKIEGVLYLPPAAEFQKKIRQGLPVGAGRRGAPL